VTFEEKFALACTLAAGRLAGFGVTPVNEPDVMHVVRMCFKALEGAERQLRPDPTKGAI
jgi:hypothetical protein